MRDAGGGEPGRAGTLGAESVNSELARGGVVPAAKLIYRESQKGKSAPK